MQAPTYRALILTLYGSGIRVGEALRLNLADVDLAERVLTVHETKFYKSLSRAGGRATCSCAGRLPQATLLRVHAPRLELGVLREP